MDTINVLYLTAAIVGLSHALLGPDHYLPFIAMSRAEHWTLRTTLGITLLCGLGHVLGSVVLGVFGVLLGTGVFAIEALERFRGDVAAWLMLAFGLAYVVWGVRRAIRHKPHTHLHVHADGTIHSHDHVHTAEHVHVHARVAESGHAAARSTTPWVLFVIFLFGPCEPLIPLLMYPSAKGSAIDAIYVTLIFAGATLATMTIVVSAGCVTMKRLSPRTGRAFNLVQRYGHALGGLVVLACGVAIKAGM